MDRRWRGAWTFLVVVLGNLIFAFGIKMFLLPGDLVTGGTTGIAQVVYGLTGFSISAFVLIFNVAMLLLGLAVLGKAFALTTVVSTFAYPIALELWNRLLGDLVWTQDPMLCTLFAGLVTGAALGMVIRSGASTGGMDIPSLVLKRLFGVPLSMSIYVFDALILLAQATIYPVEKLLYGVILLVVTTTAMDRTLTVGTTKTELKVVSQRTDQIRQAILSDVDRGVTLLQGEGGYLGQPVQLILTVVSNRELFRVERLIREIDPEAFLIVTRVSEVRGRGFSLSKDYQAEKEFSDHES